MLLKKTDVKVILILYFLLRECIPYVYVPEIDFAFQQSFKGYKYLGEFKITAYESGKKSCGKWANGRTALNMKVDFGICAVDPKIIPLGQIIYIRNLGYFITADTGKLVKGKVIDVYINSYQKCKLFSKKFKRVYLVRF